MTLDLDALEKVAQEATPGPWRHEIEPYSGIEAVIVAADDLGLGPGLEVIATVGEAISADGEHIAAFNPETALALIAEVRKQKGLREFEKARADELEAERYGWESLVQKRAEATHRGRAKAAMVERDALQAKLDKVLEVHERVAVNGDHGGVRYICIACERSYPCVTAEGARG